MSEKTIAMPVRPLIRREPVFRRKFKPVSGGGDCVAEFHPDKLVLRKVRGRKRAEYTFQKLWSLHTGDML